MVYALLLHKFLCSKAFLSRLNNHYEEIIFLVCVILPIFIRLKDKNIYYVNEEITFGFFWWHLT